MENTIDDIKKNTLFLWLNPNDYFAPSLVDRGINIFKIYKDDCVFQTVFRKIQNYFKFPSSKFVLGDWLNNINNYSTIIIPASIVTVSLVKFLNNKYADKRIIVWYWNPVEKSISPDHYDYTNCEIWSFDYDDCKKYGLKYNTQYYNMCLNENEGYNFKYKYDFVFVGSDKGRFEKLVYLKKFLDEEGFITNFIITSDGSKEKNRNFQYSNRISYDEYVNLIKCSNCIIDIVSDGQSGMSLRPLEAMCYDKKILTNNINVLNEFNSEGNVFFIDNKKINVHKLKDFLNQDTRYHNKENYDVDKWIFNFFVK